MYFKLYHDPQQKTLTIPRAALQLSELSTAEEMTLHAERGCVLLARNLEGKDILTIEGVSQDGRLHPVQQAFVDAGAIQCGFCTPGMVMTAIALLRKNPNPSREEILSALEGNLCRCTGYKKIIEAIELAARTLREGGQTA